MRKEKITPSEPLSLEEKKRLIGEMLTHDRHRLLIKMPFIGSVLLRLELIPVSDGRLDTAATNGESIFVDIDFYAKLTSEERLFVLAHEAWHCVLLHFARRQDREPERFNCAADLEIHFILTNAGLKAPFVLPHDPNWRGFSAEKIYELYKRKFSRLHAKESEHIKSTRKGGGFDSHSALGDPPPASDESERIDSDFQPEVKAAAVERCRGMQASVCQQYEKIHGKLPVSLTVLINQIYTPKINWKELLRQFVTACYGGSRQWLPPNRRHVWHGVYMQSARQQRLTAVVAMDTSPSTHQYLSLFCSELQGLLSSFGSYDLTVIQCDSNIKSVEQYSDVAPLSNDHKWLIYGMDGTDFRPVFQYVEEHTELNPNLLIYLTDGYGPSPEHAPAYPVLWLLTPDGEKPAPWGQEAVFNDAEPISL